MAEIFTLPINNRAEDLILELDEVVAELQNADIKQVLASRLIREDNGRKVSAAEALAELGHRITTISAMLRQYEVAKGGAA